MSLLCFVDTLEDAHLMWPTSPPAVLPPPPPQNKPEVLHLEAAPQLSQGPRGLLPPRLRQMHWELVNHKWEREQFLSGASAF